MHSASSIFPWKMFISRVTPIFSGAILSLAPPPTPSRVSTSPSFFSICSIRRRYCRGIQIHITDTENYEPVFTAISVYDSIIRTNPLYLEFNQPPYEYEYSLMPFDILMGDSATREALIREENVLSEKERWISEVSDFQKKFSVIKYY